jgi:hypothetical protein
MKAGITLTSDSECEIVGWPVRIGMSTLEKLGKTDVFVVLA